MLKCASLYTYEVDDPLAALREIKTQLEEKLPLLPNTVGVVMCHTEFISTGVLKYICDNLPFDLAGVTTSSQAVNDEVGEIILTIFVMTSDDVSFKSCVTDALDEEVDGPLRASYDSVTTGASGQLKLALVFPPFGLRAGDAYVRAWNKVTPGTPVFGTLAIDDTATFQDCETIYNGESYKTAMPFVLCYGNIHPRFLIAALSESSAASSKAEITKAADNNVYEVNHVNALQFFKEKGFAESVLYTPFLIDLLRREDYDGVPVVRGFASFTEDGTAVFHGDIDEGSTFIMLKCEPDDIVSTTCREVERLNALPDVNGALLLPCVVRRVTLLGVDKPLLELESARSHIDTEIPFMMGYAGGEFCPTSMHNGIPTNRFHNYSLVILVI